MENQINIGIQRQSYEAFDAVDSEAGNSNADASLADDSAGANTGGNPNVVVPHIEGESVNPAAPETVATNNLLNRYGISDGIIIQRPDYALNNRAAPDPAPVCPDQADPASSGLEPTTPFSAKPMGKAGATPSANSSINSANVYNLSAAPPVPRDCADYQAARAFGAAHGYSEIKTEKFAALLHYQDPQNRYDYCDSLKNSPYQISILLDLVPTNADGTFDLALGQRIMDERFRAPAFPDDPDAGNRFRDYGGGAGRDFLGGPDFRAGAGQGAQGYANEMTMAAPDYGYSYDYDDTTNTYDSPDSTYDGPDSTPQIDLDPLPSLPPVDSSGPMMLPPPDIRLDREVAPLPNIGVQSEAERTPAPQATDAALTSYIPAPGISETTAPGDSTRGGSTRIGTGQGGNDEPTEEIVLTPEEEAQLPRTSVEIGPLREISKPSTPSKPEEQGILWGLNADGQPLRTFSGKPSQGEYRAAPDAPSLIAGDPVLRADATGATPLRDESGTLYYRVNGGSMDGQIIYVQPTAATITPHNEPPAPTL